MHNFAKAVCQPRTVLVVDSDPAVLALLSMILEGPKTTEKPKMRVLGARSVPEAIDVLSRPYVRVDLVLYNKSLSESDGFAERVRTLNPRLPVMFMSGITGARIIQIHGEAGGSGLERTVVASLERHRTLRAMSAAHCTGNCMSMA